MKYSLNYHQGNKTYYFDLYNKLQETNKGIVDFVFKLSSGNIVHMDTLDSVEYDLSGKIVNTYHQLFKKYRPKKDIPNFFNEIEAMLQHTDFGIVILSVSVFGGIPTNWHFIVSRSVRYRKRK